MVFQIVPEILYLAVNSRQGSQKQLDANMANGRMLHIKKPKFVHLWNSYSSFLKCTYEHQMEASWKQKQF